MGGDQKHFQKRDRNVQRDECERALKKAKLDQKAAAAVTQVTSSSEAITDERYGKLILALMGSHLFQAFLKRWTVQKRSTDGALKPPVRKISGTPPSPKETL